METDLNQLREHLIQHVQSADQVPLKKLGIFHTHQFQALRSVPIHQPSIIFVLDGTKSLVMSEQKHLAESGFMLIAPGNVTLSLTNEPSSASGHYLALTVSFSDDIISQYRKLSGPKINKDIRPTIQCEQMPELLIRSLFQWVELCQQSNHAATSDMLHQLKAFEVLTHIESMGVIDDFLANFKPSWKGKVMALVQSDLAQNWSLGEVCRQLGTSESSLRRHLQSEDTSFRDLLEDCRLVAALAMLQESYRPIGHIAMDVGYANQGHFAERFKKRFAMSPSELRQTREPRAAG